MSRSLPRIYALAAAAFIAAYFLYFTVGSLRTEFTHDDLMNCYRAWFHTLPDLLTDNLLFFRFSPTFRPFGALVYKASFALFGFDLFPLRVLLLLVLGANIFLTYKLCRALTGSTEMGLFGALALAYHMKLWPLYYTTGTLYDLFCFLFYFSALTFYIQKRQEGRELNLSALVVVCVLYILALNSKEAAVSFPVMLLLYELLWHPPFLTKPALMNWFSRQALAAWVASAITAAYIAGRVFFPTFGLGNVTAYQATISVNEYLSKAAFYFGELFYTSTWFDSRITLLILLSLLFVSAVSFSRTLLFGSLLFMVGILPLAFIPARVLSAVYLPLAGFSICAAVLLGFLLNALIRISERQTWPPAAFLVVFLATGFLLIRMHHTVEHIYVAFLTEYSQVRETREQLAQLYPEMAPGSRILILKTPFPQYTPGYQTLFLIRLLYNDVSLTVDELARLQENHAITDLASYDCVLSYEEGRLVDVDPAALTSDATGL